MNRTKKFEFAIIIILIVSICSIYLDRYYDLGIFFSKNDKIDKLPINNTISEINISTLYTDNIPNDAELITNAATYIKQIEHVLNSWDDKINLGNKTKHIKRFYQIDPSKLEGLNMDQRIKVMQKEKERNIAEYNYRHEAHLPEVSFDRLLSVLDCIQLQENYVLDYIYYFDGMSGIPIIYSRRIDESPYDCLINFPNWEKYLINYHFGESLDRHFINNIKLDNSALSYFQLAVLALYCDHFFLSWHSNYRDETIMTNIDDFLETMESDEFKVNNQSDSTTYKKLVDLKNVQSQISLTPYVIFYDDVAQVVFYYLTYWGGLYKVDWKVSKSFPHREVSFKKYQVINYEPSIIF